MSAAVNDKTQGAITMKITLATVHCNPKYTPLALLYLKAYLINKTPLATDDVKILEFSRKIEAEEVTRQILNTDPVVIGLSCYVWNIVTLMAVCRKIKESRPDIKIVLGGPEVGPVASSVLRMHPYVDVVVRSEGEVPLSEIVDAFIRGHELDGVRGIAFRFGEEIRETAEAIILKDLDSIPSPHLSRYGNYEGRIICIETQRGCVFKCNFCFYNKDLSIRNRRFSLDRVKGEILFWLNQDVDQIFLMDPVFNLNARRAKDICRFVAQHNHRKIPFHTEVWAEFIDEEMAQLFKQAKFMSLEVGLQTIDNVVLDSMERRLNIGRFIDGIGYLKKCKVNFELQLIYGLPGESRESFKQSLDFAASLQPPLLSVFPLMILPGTELWRKAEQLNLNFDHEPPYRIRSHPSMNSIDIQYGNKLNRALRDLGVSLTMSLLCKIAKIGYSDILEEWISWCDSQHYDALSRPMAEKVGSFLKYFCARREIPEEFFFPAASREYGLENTEAHSYQQSAEATTFRA